jgi:hypothetical protein
MAGPKEVRCNLNSPSAITAADPPRRLTNLLARRQGDEALEALPGEIETIPRWCHGAIIRAFGIADVPVPKLR